MTEEMKQKRDELAKLNRISDSRDFSNGFDAGYQMASEELGERIKKLEAENEKSETDCHNLIVERDFREDQINEIADTLGDNREWSNLNDRGENCIETIENLQSRIEKLEAENAELKAENAELLESEKVSESLDKNAQAAIRHFREENAELKRNVELLREHKKQDSNERAVLKSRIEKLKDALPCGCTYDEQCSYCFAKDEDNAALKADEGEG